MKRSGLRDEVRDIEQFLGVIVGGLDPDAVPLGEAKDVWVEFDKVERLVTSAKALLARRVEEAGSWKREGCRSAAEQLARLSGTSDSAARVILETSKKARALPACAAALRSGKLSGAKARVVIGAAAVNGDAEAGLLDDAESMSFGELADKGLKARAKDSKARA